MRHGACLVAEVELLGELLTEPGDDRPHERRVATGDPRCEARQQPRHDLEVARDFSPDARTRHLHRHVAAVSHPGAVHHRDRRAADRARIDPAEHVAERPAELGLDRGLDAIEPNRTPGVEQRAELLGHLRAEHAGRGRDELTELHVRCAEVLEGAAHLTGELSVGDLPTGTLADQQWAEAWAEGPDRRPQSALERARAWPAELDGNELDTRRRSRLDRHGNPISAP